VRVLGLEGGSRAVCGHVGVQEERDLILGVSAGPGIAPGRNALCRTHRTRTQCIVEGASIRTSKDFVAAKGGLASRMSDDGGILP